MITSIMAYATMTFLCGNKKIRARGWLSSPLLRCIYLFYLFIYLNIYFLFMYLLFSFEYENRYQHVYL